MKKLFLTTAAVVLFSASTGFATPSVEGDTLLIAKPVPLNLQILADKGGNSGGGNSGGGSDDGADHDSNDDHGGSSSNDDDNDDDRGGNSANDDDNSNGNGAKRDGGRKPRVPGGSGCDSAQDRAEHPECNV